MKLMFQMVVRQSGSNSDRLS